MPSRAVRAMFRNHQDQLWLGMERGPLLCLKPDGLQSFTGKYGLPNQRVVFMTEDQEDAVWIVYPTHLRRVLNGQVKPVALPVDWREQADIVAARDGLGNIRCAKGRQLGVWEDGRWQSCVSLEAPVTALGPGGRSNLWSSAGGRLFTFMEGTAPAGVIQLPAGALRHVLFEDRSLRTPRAGCGQRRRMANWPASKPTIGKS